MTEPIQPTTLTKPKSRWKRVKRILVIGVLLVVAALGVAIYLIRTPPAHWREHQQFLAEHTTAEIETLAQETEDQINDLILADLDTDSAPQSDQELNSSKAEPGQTSATEPVEDEAPQKIDPTMVRIDEVRTMVLTQKQVTAMVTARHESWMKSRGYVKPAEIVDPMLRLEQGSLIAAFKYETKNFSQILTGKFKLTFREDGQAALKLKTFQAGRLSIPAEKIGDYLAKNADNPESAEATGEWLSKLEEVKFKPVLDDLPHRRRARVLAFQVNDTSVTLTVRVQDFRTYAEMNERLEAGTEKIQVAAVPTN